MSTMIESLLNEHEVASLLKVSVATIRRRRLFRQPPEFVKIGASVRYRPAAIQRLIESSESSTAHFQAASVKAHSGRAIRSGAQRNAR
jgi:predicted DNA-binding transcriptional regulator AlpA